MAREPKRKPIDQGDPGPSKIVRADASSNTCSFAEISAQGEADVDVGGKQRGPYNKLCEENLAYAQAIVTRILRGGSLAGEARDMGISKGTMRGWVAKAKNNNGVLPLARRSNTQTASSLLEAAERKKQAETAAAMVAATETSAAAAVAAAEAVADVRARAATARIDARIGMFTRGPYTSKLCDGNLAEAQTAVDSVVNGASLSGKAKELGMAKGTLRGWVRKAQANGGILVVKTPTTAHKNSTATNTQEKHDDITSKNDDCYGDDVDEDAHQHVDNNDIQVPKANEEACSPRQTKKRGPYKYKLCRENLDDAQAAVTNIIIHKHTIRSEANRIGIPHNTLKSWVRKARKNDGQLSLNRSDQALTMAQEKTLMEFALFWDLTASKIKQKALEMHQAIHPPDTQAGATANQTFVASNGWYDSWKNRWSTDKSLARFREIAAMRRNGSLDSIGSWCQANNLRETNGAESAVSVDATGDTVPIAVNATVDDSAAAEPGDAIAIPVPATAGADAVNPSLMETIL